MISNRNPRFRTGLTYEYHLTADYSSGKENSSLHSHVRNLGFLFETITNVLLDTSFENRNHNQHLQNSAIETSNVINLKLKKVMNIEFETNVSKNTCTKPSP